MWVNLKLYHNSVYFCQSTGEQFWLGSHNLPPFLHRCPCKTLKTHNASCLLVPGLLSRTHPICVNWIPSCSLYVVGHPESHYLNSGQWASQCCCFPLQQRVTLILWSPAKTPLTQVRNRCNCCRDLSQMDFILLSNKYIYIYSISRFWISEVCIYATYRRKRNVWIHASKWDVCLLFQQV